MTTQNGRTMDRSHAIVHTATIEVKTMSINNKQVTLSVFRQIDEETVFSVDGSLRGVPWGRVNYLWKDNKPDTAFHVVWQDGEKLKRSPVPKLNRLVSTSSWEAWCWDNFKDYLPSDVKEVLNAFDCDCLDGVLKGFRHTYYLNSASAEEIRLALDLGLLSRDSDYAHLLSELESLGEVGQNPGKVVAGTQRLLIDILRAIQEEANESVDAVMDVVKLKERELLARSRETWKAVSALDQLFIAV